MPIAGISFFGRIDRLQRQTKMNAVLIHIQDLHSHPLIDAHERMNVAHIAFTDLRNVNQAVMTAVQGDRGPVRLDSRDNTSTTSPIE